ncbi:MAG: response regulator transcription factor [Sterolibacterium sp.]|jgi:DNA-binding NarL/FixJ family response regulator|nr:response regulator transcription factor [Sterolibacterium sp.]
MKSALILDDVPAARDLLGEVASHVFPEIRLEKAASLAAAHLLLAQPGSFYDLALIDLALPDGHGTELIAALAQSHPACLIVVASIFDDDAHLFPALRAGAQGYLLKEQSREQLERQLGGIVDGQPPLSPAIARRLMRHFQLTEENPPDSENPLTPREREVLGWLAQGIRLAEIAEKLHISRHTAGDHVKNIYRKLNISSRAEAALQARTLGLV